MRLTLDFNDNKLNLWCSYTALEKVFALSSLDFDYVTTAQIQRDKQHHCTAA
ncbi:MAG TPA: hypothetical protein V6D27_15840 [Vampirovibrionales bacterium]